MANHENPAHSMLGAFPVPIHSGRQINWNRIYQFAEVAACGSIKTAAERMGLSPSTLSEHISHLENELSVRLFVREHRRLRLTSEGARLAAQAKQLFEAGRRMIDFVSPLPLGAYSVQVGSVSGAALPEVRSFIATYLERFGPLSLNYTSTQPQGLEEGLLRGQIDFGFSPLPSEHGGLRSLPLARVECGLFATPELAHRPLRELLRDLPLLIVGTFAGLTDRLEALLNDADIAIRTVVRAEAPGFLLDLCKRGQGIGFFNRHWAAGELTEIDAPWASACLREDVHLLWAKDGEFGAAVQNLLLLLREREPVSLLSSAPST